MTEERTYAYRSRETGLVTIRFRVTEHGGNGHYKLSYKYPQQDKSFKPYPGLKGKRFVCPPTEIWAALEKDNAIGERIRIDRQGIL